MPDSPDARGRAEEAAHDQAGDAPRRAEAARAGEAQREAEAGRAGDAQQPVTPPRQPALRRRAWPIPLALLGLLGLALAAILAWGVAPGRKQLPENLDATREFTGTASVLLNRQALDTGDFGNALTTDVPISEQRTVRVLEVRGGVARVQEERTLMAAGQALGAASTTYAVDRHSLEPATDPPAEWEATPHEGLTVSFPIEAEPRDYSGWVPDTQTTAPIRFVRQEPRGGVDTFVYEAETEPAPIRDETVLSSLPATLSRAQLQGLMPSLPISAEQRALLARALPALPDELAVTYTHQSGATYWVEPTTGMIIDSQQRVIRIGTVGGPGGAVLATMPVYNVDSRFTDGAVSAAARDANDRRDALTRIGSTWPWALGTLGLLALLAGLLGLLARRRPQPRPVPTSYRPTERTTASGRDLGARTGADIDAPRRAPRRGQPQAPYAGQTPHTGPYRESRADQPVRPERDDESRREQPGQPPGRRQPPGPR